MGGACILFIWAVAKAKLIGRRFFSRLVLSCLLSSCSSCIGALPLHCSVKQGDFSIFGASGSVYEEFVTLVSSQPGLFKLGVCVVQSGCGKWEPFFFWHIPFYQCVITLDRLILTN